MACSCNYSYTCDECRVKLSQEQLFQFQKEIRDWTVQSIQSIAARLGVKLPEAPEAPVDRW